MSERFVTLKRLHDPIEAELAVGVLEEAGIPVTASGLNHRAMLGMVGSFVDITLQVPADRADEARELLDALAADADAEDLDDLDEDDPDDPDDFQDPEDDEANDPDDEPGYDEDDEEPRPRGARARPSAPPRLKRVAAFAALTLTFGGGHFYARSYGRALTLLVAEFLALALGLSGEEAHALYFVPLVIAADLFGSFEAVERFNTGAPRPGVGPWLWRTLPLVLPFVVVVPYVVRLTSPGTYVGEGGRFACAVASSCMGEDTDACDADLAERLASGRLRRSTIATCVECARTRSCEALYEHHRCEGEVAPESASILASPLLGASRGCEAESLLRQCTDECGAVLPQRMSSSRRWRQLEDAAFTY